MAKSNELWEVLETLNTIKTHVDNIEKACSAYVKIVNDCGGYWNLTVIYDGGNCNYMQTFTDVEELEKFLYAVWVGVNIDRREEL